MTKAKEKTFLLFLLVSIMSLPAFFSIVLCACRYSPTSLEVPTVLAGIAHLKQLEFSAYSVNPPLGKVAFAAATHDEISVNFKWPITRDSAERPEFAISIAYASEQKTALVPFINDARLANLLWLSIAIILVWVISRKLGNYDTTQSLVSVMLFLYTPFIIGHSALAVNDMAAIASGLLATHCLLNWSAKQSFLSVCILGASIGIAISIKFTWLVLLIVVPIVVMARMLLLLRVKTYEYATKAMVSASANIIIISIMTAIVINFCYMFDGTFQPLDHYSFSSNTLKEVVHSLSTFRFGGNWILNCSVPLPFWFIKGFDLQLKDLEEYSLPSYYSGIWNQNKGVWWYYLLGLAVKVPHIAQIFLLSGVLYLGYSIKYFIQVPSPGSSRQVHHAWNLWILALPAVAVFVAASSNDEFSTHFRYVFPSYPVFIIIGSVALFKVIRTRIFRRFIFIAATILSLANLYHFPHFIPYSNYLSGGTSDGWRHMLGSSYDWGQDMLFIQDYLARHNIPIDEVRVENHGYRYWECIYPDIWERQKGPFKYDLVSANVLTRPEKDYLKRLEAGESTRICYTAWLFPIKDDASPTN